jgi:hypothetical protein
VAQPWPSITAWAVAGLGATWHVPGRASTDERCTRARRRGEIWCVHSKTEGRIFMKRRGTRDLISAVDLERDGWGGCAAERMASPVNWRRRRGGAMAGLGRNSAGVGSRPRISTRRTRKGRGARGELNRGVAQQGGWLCGGARRRWRRLMPASKRKTATSRGNPNASGEKERGGQGEAYRGIARRGEGRERAHNEGERRGRRRTRRGGWFRGRFSRAKGRRAR